MLDFILVGGGIVGVSTAWQLKQRYPDAQVLLVEKEERMARHQTGRNSGVIHAGVYYAPGSLKADFCRRGAVITFNFCREHGLPVEQCGKLLVATDAQEVHRLAALEERCRQNRIRTIRLSREELKQREPHIEGLAALFVPTTGITDYARITATMARQFAALGGRVRTGRPVTAIREEQGGVRVTIGGKTLRTRYLVACGGLMADRLARMMHIDIDFQIIPFRGEYYALSKPFEHRFNHLIYPIPDPDLPFLGVHLTRMIDGRVTVGPNAVLGWKREGYGAVNLDPVDILEMLRFPGFWKVIGAHLSSGLGEMRDSLLRSGYLKRVQKYCPAVRLSDLRPYPTGIRAQAVLRDGALVHDFLFAESERSLHVCNAPSPAATSAIPIGEYICEKLGEKFLL
ncbi:hydroxyglutarate oxidase [Desulfosarcina ovata subsp. sediminis]|uniref:Hydroxyglutarate oxidase n=1 Tax=Desulfosarcina ovata subsp. sediminis TaxID=885957 RepID=A0A5K7ZXU2_9BACT|nr:L-2-hydroxyglutarate oxidase [Desulfosarcina ovata]BBO85069.1 hydroxyglutarate oxidase [Desulfosarcina ovata subsp. sediminis]